MDLKQLYQDIILEHGKSPRNLGKCKGYSHEAKGYNPLCGDKVHIYLKFDNGKKVENLTFEGDGCAISLASASIMTELVKGKSFNEAKDIMSDMKNKVIEEIKKIFDPEIPVNIYELGLIYKIEVDETNKVNIDMTLTSPNCPAAESLPNQVKEDIMELEEVSDVNLKIVWEPPWDKDKMSEAAKLELNI